MAEEKSSIVGRSSGYLSDSISELKKVVFPTKQETIQATIVTVIIVIFVSVCLFLLDVIFNQLMSTIVG